MRRRKPAMPDSESLDKVIVDGAETDKVVSRLAAVLST